ncbi:MAG: hypothetical protein LWY06_18245 [Firmicutes bacterium]|nr:hypothetical protein [Bacillota bacterium]
MDRLGAITNNTLMPIKMDLKPIAQTEPQESTLTLQQDSVNLTGNSEASETSTPRGAEAGANASLRDNMESVRSMIDSCIYDARNTNSKMGSTKSNLSSAKSNLSSTSFPLMMAQNDTKDKDVSSEGFSLKNYISSAERSLESGKWEDREAENSMDGIKRNVDSIRGKLEQLSSDLTSSEHSASAKHIKAAIQKITNSQNDAFRSQNEIDKTGRDIESGLGELRFGESFISDIQFDRPGSDVSFSARMLSSRIEDAKWKVDSADSSSNNAQYSINNLISSLDSVKQSVTQAQNALPK